MATLQVHIASFMRGDGDIVPTTGQLIQGGKLSTNERRRDGGTEGRREGEEREGGRAVHIDNYWSNTKHSYLVDSMSTGSAANKGYTIASTYAYTYACTHHTCSVHNKV